MFLQDRMWRKTRSVNPPNICVGVDPNRNWDVNWSGRTTLGQFGVVAKVIAFGAGGLGFDSWVGQTGHSVPAVRHRCDVSSELCCSGAKPRRWISSLVTRFGVIPRVYSDEDFFLKRTS